MKTDKNERKLITDFYMWMIENDYDHNIRIRVENKAELFLRDRKPVKNDCIGDVSNSKIIDYIENNAEISMPIDEMFNEDGTHITKKQYGKVLLKYLVKELRAHYE